MRACGGVTASARLMRMADKFGGSTRGRCGLVGIAPGLAPKAYRLVSVEIFTMTDKNIGVDEDKQVAEMMPVYLQRSSSSNFAWPSCLRPSSD